MIMNDYEQHLEQKKSKVLVENNAQAIFDHLTEIANLGGIHERRWLWELLQNAKDAVDESSTVSVEIDFQKDHLLFQHNGTPFTDDEIIHLIYHGTTKKGSIDKTGKFGTGFLTTHLLSKKVLVSGILNDGKGFNFVLDRSGKSAKEVEAAMESSWRDFKEARNDYTNHFFTTTYRYELEDQSEDIAEKGLHDLPRLLPFVLAFNPKFKSFTMKTLKESKTFFRSHVQIIDHSTIAIVSIESSDDSSATSCYTLAISSENKTSVAVPCTIITGKVMANPLDADIPRLFYDFPLFGTEDFSFPAVINSSHFIPKSERDGIYLGDKTSEDIAINKRIIEEACRLYIHMTEYASSSKWENLHELAFIPSLKPKDWLDLTWIKRSLQQLLESLITMKIVGTDGPEYVSPRHALFPIDFPLNDLWELSSPIFPSRLPAKFHMEAWLKVVKSWSDLLDRRVESFDNTLTFQKLCESLSELKTLERLTATLLAANGDAISWLNRLYRLLLSQEKKLLFESYAIIPNQNGVFQKKTSGLFLDEQIDETIKDISKTIGDDWRDRLVLKTVSLDNSLLALKSQEEVLSSTVKALKQQAAKNNQDSQLRGPVIDILIWLVRQKRADEIPDMPVVSRKVESTLSTPFSALSITSRLLLPPEQWQKVPTEFAELFPPEFILSSEYNDRFMVADWQFLAENHFVYIEPLFDEDTVLDNQFIFPEEEGHQLASVKCSRITFLEQPKDKTVIDRIRKNKQRSVLFLKFLLTCIIEKDPKWQVPIEVPCECSLSHPVLPSHWFYYVKSRRWIPSSHGGSEALSALSLAALIENEQTLISKMKEDKPAFFLNKLGIGVGELLKNVITGGDDLKKLEWDKAFGAILTSGLDPSQLLTEFEEREKNREKVLSNQELGRRIEGIFEATFKLPEFKALGFSITRKPIGSDFEVEHDFIEGEQEQALKIDGSKHGVLIELKATGKPFVRMTNTQGKTAVDHPKSFCLCVVPLPGNEVDDDIVRAAARFVTNIGELLKSKVSEASTLQDLRDEAVSTGGDIQIDMSESQIRYRVNKAVWQTGKTFDEFITLLMTT